jgi:hypothetical protein
MQCYWVNLGAGAGQDDVSRFQEMQLTHVNGTEKLS